MRLLFVDQSTRLNTIADLAAQGRGGMVSSLFQVTDHLAGRGHTVHVLAGIQQPGQTAAGAWWLQEPERSYDVIVGNRGMGQARINVSAKARILWTHDLPHNGFALEPKELKAVHVVFMSRFAQRIWRAFFPTIRRGSIIPNGIDPQRFRPGLKDRFTLLYCSAPNRGLKRLPLILDAVRSRVSPDVRCLAYSNLARQHPAEIRNGDPYEATYKTVHESAVELHDPIPQAALADVMQTAGVLLMPSDYPEICSNNILQALACGMPVITTRMGSAGEWIRSGRNGYLMDWWPQHGMIYDVEFVRRLMDTIREEKTYQWMSKHARQTRLWTWAQVGQRWERLCRQLC